MKSCYAKSQFHLLCQQFEKTVEDVAARSLTGVHSRRHEDDRLGLREAQRPCVRVCLSLREETLAIGWDRFSLVSDPVSRRNRDQFHLPALQRVVKYLSVEIDVWLVTHSRFHLINLFKSLLVGEGEREGEVSRLVLRVGKHVAEGDCELVFGVDERYDFGHDSSPFLLVGRRDSVDGFEALIVEFALKRVVS